MGETWLERQQRTAGEASAREQERQRTYSYEGQMKQEEMRKYVEERRIRIPLKEKMQEQIRHIQKLT